VLALAVAIRFWPLLQFSLWGSDSGEYFFLSSRLVGTGAISTDYGGWGFGYPYFPGMFLLTGEVRLLTGIPMLQAMQLAAPLAASLSVLVIFLITVRTFDDARAGLLAGAVLAVVTPAVYATSHPMPGSIGDMLALLCILLLLRSLESRSALVALGLATAALIMTHHLSTFFVLVPVAFALLGRELVRQRTDRRRSAIEAGYLVCLLSGTMLYWYAYATPFRERVIPEGFGFSPWTVLAMGFAALLAIPLLVGLRRRLAPGVRYRPAFPSVRRVAMFTGAFIAAGAAVLAAIALMTTPGTSINIDDRAAYWFLPLLIVLALAIGGIGRSEFSRDGFFVELWMGAVAITLLFGIATNSHVLLPYRQTEYFIQPMAVLIGAGAVFLHDSWNPDRKRAVSVLAAVALSALVAMCAVTAYPPREIMGGFEEGTASVEMDGVLWLREDGRPAELVATDHRLSSLVFGFSGLNASWDDARDTLHGNLSEARAEMAGLETPSGLHAVTLVLLSPSIEAGAALTQWETARPLTGEALAKFSSEAFLKIYESNGVEVFRTDIAA
jgi:4-amino-4-deoxy-L-arabinose transferase-like glycosyltransferase